MKVNRYNKKRGQVPIVKRLGPVPVFLTQNFRGCLEGESNRPSFEFGDALPHPSILTVNIPYNKKKSIPVSGSCDFEIFSVVV
jgi:hypothetical protein